jgi:elongation of very long chain fatty acids protein 6
MKYVKNFVHWVQGMLWVGTCSKRCHDRPAIRRFSPFSCLFTITSDHGLIDIPFDPVMMGASYNASDVHSYYHPIENEHNWPYWNQWCLSRPHYPVIGVLLYIFLIRYGPSFMSERKPLRVKYPLFLWNTGFALFSLIASIRAVSYISYNIRQEDFSVEKILCDNDPDNVSGFWTFLFTMSKFLELGDTLFLIIRKKPIMFLHWYHHLTVLMFTWLAAVINAPIGKFFATMNAIVHTFMYAYYAIHTLDIIRLPKIISISITCMQIFQMVAGIFILTLSYTMSLKSTGCRSPAVICVIGATIYGSYFALFVDFFVRSYFIEGKKQKSV